MIEPDAGRTRASGGHGHLPVYGHRGFDAAAPTAGPRALRRAALATQRAASLGVRAEWRDRGRPTGRLVLRRLSQRRFGGRGSYGSAARSGGRAVAGGGVGARADGPAYGRGGA